MITPKKIKQAQSLLHERSRVAKAKWNAVTYDPGLDPSPDVPAALYQQTGIAEGADEELQAAIEEFRQRKLAALDAQLRDVGVDPSAPDDEKDAS